MRARILIPILVLLVVFCGVLGAAVYSNVSSATVRLLDRQIDETLRVLELEISAAQGSGANLTTARYQALIAGYGVAEGGVFIVDEKGLVIADANDVLTGTSVASSAWYEEARQNPSSEFSASYGQTPVYAHSVLVDDKLLVSCLPSKEINDLRVTPLYVIGVVGLVCVIIMGVLIYLLMTRALLNPLESFSGQLRGLLEGREIDLAPLRPCPELSASAELLNGLLVRGSVSANAPSAKKNRSLRIRRGQGSAGTGFSSEPDAASSGAGLPTQTDSHPPATDFELLTLLREVFEEQRQTIVSKRLRFSWLVGNGLPQNIVADRAQMRAGLGGLLAGACAQAAPGSEVKAELRLFSLEQAPSSSDTSSLALMFTIRYSGREESVLLEAQKGF
ncbi:MAG: hypothetical protein LBL23_00380 [Coriobacteriales bacterium]|nr:hypothetical protein [Coriobacteriales bacterium]